MKIRDWAFVILLALCVAVVMRGAAPAPQPARPGILQRAFKAVVVWWAVSEGPPPQQASYESMPHAVMNPPPVRIEGADGMAAIDNGEGW